MPKAGSKASKVSKVNSKVPGKMAALAKAVAKVQAQKQTQAQALTRTSAPKYEGLTKDEAAYMNDLIGQDRAPLLDNVARVVATFWAQGNFTVVRLLTYTNDKRLKPEELIGVAKRNPNDDEESRARAVRIVLARAARGEAQIEAS